jgi:branched-chain amino acid transport system permease protein
MRYAPLNLGRWIIWSAAALIFLAAPHVFQGGFALTMLTQMGTLILFALSYNMLLGQACCPSATRSTRAWAPTSRCTCST